MNTKILICALIAAVPLLPAQNEMPNPKTPAHEALAMLAGHWQTTCKMNAMPGAPGTESAAESQGIEHAELICNGLWLKTTTHGTYQGQPFEAIWLAGYDPVEKKYKSVWVSSCDDAASAFDGNYDATAKTWTFTGNSPMGAFRSVYAFQDADNSTETCYVKGEDGKEVQCMRITRTRTKVAPRAPEGAPVPAEHKPATAEGSLLADMVGSWKALVTHCQPPVEEQCVEKIALVCGARWAWSSFNGNLSGMPIEGHAILGYDANEKKFVAYMVDSFSAKSARISGTYDEARRALTLEGSFVDEQGRAATIHQVYSQKNKDTRHVELTVKGADGSHEMKIAYKRIDG